MDDATQVLRLLILAVPVAWAAWTVTREEVFREVREACAARSRECRLLVQRKFFYLFTCEYCFSHWVALGLDLAFQFRLVFDDWRGYVVGYAALVWTANVYMSLYQRVRVDIRKDRAAAARAEQAAGGPRAARPAAAGGGCRCRHTRAAHSTPAAPAGRSRSGVVSQFAACGIARRCRRRRTETLPARGASGPHALRRCTTTAGVLALTRAARRGEWWVEVRPRRDAPA